MFYKEGMQWKWPGTIVQTQETDGHGETMAATTSQANHGAFNVSDEISIQEVIE
jgi:hypothetical protein